MSKSKVIVLKWRKSELTDFADPYRIKANCENLCYIEWKKMEVLNEFKYLGLVLCKNKNIRDRHKRICFKEKSAWILITNTEREANKHGNNFAM